MKTDDDLFLNVPNLIHVLLGGNVPVYQSTSSFYDNLSVERLVETKDLILGYKHCSVKPVTDVKSKWYSPNYMFSGEYYPEYLQGSAYLMTYESVKRLYHESLLTPLFHLEDVFLTGFVAEKIKLIRQHHPLFRNFPDSDICSLRGTISQHLVTPAVMKKVYSFISNLNNSCAISEENIPNVKLKLSHIRRSINCVNH